MATSAVESRVDSIQRAHALDASTIGSLHMGFVVARFVLLYGAFHMDLFDEQSLMLYRQSLDKSFSFHLGNHDHCYSPSSYLGRPQRSGPVDLDCCR